MQGWNGGQVVEYSISLITGINPAKEFIPSLPLPGSERGNLCSRYSSYRVGSDEKVGSIFSTHVHEIFVQVCEFHPLGATGVPLYPFFVLQPSPFPLEGCRALQINVDVPVNEVSMRGVLSVMLSRHNEKKEKRKRCVARGKI